MKLYIKRNIGQNWTDDKTNLVLNINKTTLINEKLHENLTMETIANHFGATTQVQANFQNFLALSQR